MIILIPKTYKDQTVKHNCRQILLWTQKQKYSTKYFKIKSKITSKRSLTCASRFHHKDAGIFQLLKNINMLCHVNNLKIKNHMIISLDEEMAFEKFPTCLTVKVSERLGTQQTDLNIIKAVCSKSKPTPLKRRKTQSNSSKTNNKTLLSILSISIQYTWLKLSSIKQPKNVKGIQIHFWGLHWETLTTDKYYHQSIRMQN